MTTSLTTFNLYTDGACSGNPGPGGWAFILRPANPTGSQNPAQSNQASELNTDENIQVLNAEMNKPKPTILSGYHLKTTNNRMELTAAIEGLKILKNPCNITLYSDSQYVIKGITEWIKSWIHRNWRKTDNTAVLNTDLWKTMAKLLELHKVKAIWIKGHAGNPDNELADWLAQRQAQTNPTDPPYYPFLVGF